MSEFTPPGYTSSMPVLLSVVSHLNPDLSQEAFDALSEPDVQSKLLEALHHIRGLLFQSKITAYFQRPIFGGLGEISSDFWLCDDADGTLASGRYWPFGRKQNHWDDKPSGQIFFKEGAIEAALNAPSSPETPATSRGGRPRKADLAAAAYDAIYPQGHRTAGDGWKDVARKVSERLGEPVSQDTIQRALNAG